MGESIEEIIALFKLLPFAESDSDIEDDAEKDFTKKDEKVIDKDNTKPELLTIGPPCYTLEPCTLSQGKHIQSHMIVT